MLPVSNLNDNSGNYRPMFVKFPFFSSLILFVLIASIQFPVMAADWIQKTIDYTINTQFDSAEYLINERLAYGDSSLPVYFYYASILNSKMTHYENDEELDRFLEILNKIIDEATLFIQVNGLLDDSSKAKLYFYRGSAYGYLAYVQGKNGQWLKALDNGMASIDDLEKSVQIDSTLYDAYLGIGVYYYWRSTKLKYMLWLPFVPDMRDEGINQIKLAIEKGRYSAALGMQQLIYILLDYGRFDEAIPYAQKVVELYPKSQFMRWAHAHVYYKKHDYDKAIESYFKLLELIRNDSRSNPSHWLFCQTRLAEIYFKQKKYELAIQYAKQAIDYKSVGPFKEKEKEKLEQAWEIFYKSKEALGKQK
jgi:tetratricopeptide (TPR) repeat protein